MCLAILVLLVIHFCTGTWVNSFFLCLLVHQWYFWYLNWNLKNLIKMEEALIPPPYEKKIVVFQSYFFLSAKQFSKLCAARREKSWLFHIWKRIIWTQKNIQILRLDSDPNTHISEGLFTLLKLIPCSCHYLPQKVFLYFNIYYIPYSVFLIKFYL